ncbi:MAG: hypothetical protein DCF15_14660 [Phormidesmis priestleyi]|uniref:Orc1-like AAA ATPase domain-containing protein n=1 Tax=Phormidesmis priestleyi TaxID=268141 RepID=A0A2W4YXT6_9CYAN|nr:MAG: hypothetical protein DCF15_14660 [Phormidesmis priestleyi]
MSDIRFWKPVSQLFKPERPLLVDQELRDFYVLREDSPVDKLALELKMADEPAKYLLAGHRGGGKTTELRRLETRCKLDYTMVWVDTDTNLDKFNIGHAEVVVLIGMSIVQQLEASGWKLPNQLETNLLGSLARITYQDRDFEEGGWGLPKVFADLGLLLRVGFQQDTKTTREVRPALGEIIDRVNDIIEAAQHDRRELLVIVDGLDRKEYSIALEMFSSSLLTALNCHIVYAVPIALRYSPAFRQPMQGFSSCLDLDNVPVFKCSDQRCPTIHPDPHGRKILNNVISKRLNTLADTYENLCEAEAIELLCEKSGGVMRDLVRLARTACMVALQEKATRITQEIAEEAVREERRTYSIEDYHFPELDEVNRTGSTTSNVFDSPRGKVVICEELLHHKLILGYEDPGQGRWFDINPILADDLKRWRAAKG